MQPFPHPSDATHKFDQDWPTGFRDTFKFEGVDDD